MCAWSSWLQLVCAITSPVVAAVIQRLLLVYNCWHTLNNSFADSIIAGCKFCNQKVFVLLGVILKFHFITRFDIGMSCLVAPVKHSQMCILMETRSFPLLRPIQETTRAKKEKFIFHISAYRCLDRIRRMGTLRWVKWVERASTIFIENSFS